MITINLAGDFSQCDFSKKSRNKSLQSSSQLTLKQTRVKYCKKHRNKGLKPLVLQYKKSPDFKNQGFFFVKNLLPKKKENSITYCDFTTL